MNRIIQLQQQIDATATAPHSLLVEYIKELVKEVRELTAEERGAHGDLTDHTGRPPQSKGEDVVWGIIECIGQEGWVSYDTADDLMEVLEIAGQLDMNTDDPRLWQALFEKVDALS